ncbi:ATP-dependent DNA ligase [Nocardioides lentus]|uniref:DNA ligase (ATP) n=1 Tax=Nocardioides lentus TaxID=338077 RepID=A0ABP5ANV4_9ACTN
MPGPSARTVSPMLASPTKTVPSGAEWLHEVKWDGVRVILEVSGGAVRTTSRNGNVTTAAWPELATSPLGDRDLVLDGEVIALNEAGVPDFRVLQHRMHVRRAAEVARLVRSVPVTLMAFDLLGLDGEDLTAAPLVERRERLAGLDLTGSAWAVPEAYDDGAMLLEATRAQGLEGVVSKRRASPYRPGVRSPDWLKLAHRHRGTYVVGGWRPQVGTDDRLAAVLVGEPTADGLAYRGRVGSGLSGATARRLQALLEPLAAGRSPFADAVPRVDATGTRWVEPVVVVDVDTHGAGYDRLRQPSFQGVRDDVAPEDLLVGRDPGRGGGRG